MIWRSLRSSESIISGCDSRATRTAADASSTRSMAESGSRRDVSAAGHGPAWASEGWRHPCHPHRTILRP
ncbi:hypothetical protein HYQ46_007763 [Verticillium longisporum]|nr:hypothetical protein HYQ46_007763 [Verticillium longisporum]